MALDEDASSPRDASGEATELIALIDRLEAILVSSGLGELEVESGGTVVRLQLAPAPTDLDPALLATMAALQAAGPQARTGSDRPGGSPADGAAVSGGSTSEDEAVTRHAVLAPLTGVFYDAPSPGAAAYVQVGSHVSAGQVIGLIEAMKLFNEIKSDITGKVTRVVARTGALVKAKQPLIEVEPG